jgi:hypothetical protein
VVIITTEGNAPLPRDRGDRPVPLAGERACADFLQPHGRRHLPLVEAADVAGGFLDRGLDLRLDPGLGLLEFLLGGEQALRRQDRAVDLVPQFGHRTVAAAGDPRGDRPDRLHDGAQVVLGAPHQRGPRVGGQCRQVDDVGAAHVPSRLAGRYLEHPA